MASWPLIARTAELDALVAGLTRTPARAQLLRGPSGVGKTTLAAAIATTLKARKRTIVPVVALDELRGVPLGALAPLLASAPVDDKDHLSERLGALIAMVGQRADDYLLVVDDAPLLDDASAAALYQLIRVFGVATLMTARDEHAISGAMARLLHEDLMTVTDLHGLTLDETRTVLRRRFSVEPRPETLRLLYETTRGNPLFLRELVLAAERAGRVHIGSFGVEIEPVGVPAHVRETVSGRLAGLTVEQRHIVELVAVAQPWPRAASPASELDDFDDLVDAGILVAAEPAASGYFHLSHPVFADALLSALSHSERAARRRAAAERLLLIDDAPVRFTAVCLLVDAHGEVEIDQLMWGAEHASRVGDHSRAVQLADHALTRGDDLRAAMTKASALSALGDDADLIEAAFIRAAELASDDEARAFVELRWGQHTAVRTHNPAAAVSRAMQLLPTLGERASAIIAPDLAKWRLMAGDPSAVGHPFTARSDDDSAASLNACLGQAMMATMMGKSDEARAAITAGRPLADRFASVQPHASDLLDLSTFLVHVADGRIIEAREFAEQRRSQPFADSAGVWSYALSLIHLHAGRLHDALPLALLAIEQLRWRDFTGLVGPAIALGATVHAQLGDVDAARRLCETLEPTHRDDVKVVLQVAEAEAWLAIVTDEPERAEGILVAAIARAVELGHLLLAALTASVAIRVGSAAAVRRVLAAADSASGSLLVNRVTQLAEAVANRNAAIVIVVAGELQAAGLASAAHASLVQAADWATGDRMLERRARVAAAELGLTIVAVRSARATRTETGLTEREWMIAKAAARRERSREIADRLGVSVRTVDNHLASVYRKLGITGRSELEVELRETL